MEESARLQSGLDRIVFFSDAVFAIAITLLAIDLRLPSGLSDAELTKALRELLPDIEAFVLSFAVVGVFWIAHHRMWRSITRWNQQLLLLNLSMLLVVAFVPFPTSMLGEYGDTVAATALYSGTVLLLGLMSAAIWWYASWNGRLVDPGLPPAQVRAMRASGMVAPIVFGIALAAAFVTPLVSQFLWWSAFLARPVVARITVRRSAPRRC
jgi:uncharacterized membrane protein